MNPSNGWNGGYGRPDGPRGHFLIEDDLELVEAPAHGIAAFERAFQNEAAAEVVAEAEKRLAIEAKLDEIDGADPTNRTVPGS